MPIGTILIDLRDESFIFTELLYLNDNEIDSIYDKLWEKWGNIFDSTDVFY